MKYDHNSQTIRRKLYQTFSCTFMIVSQGIHIFFNWDSLQVRLHSHYNAASYKKKNEKMMKKCIEELIRKKTRAIISGISRLNTIKIIGERKVLYRQRISQTNCARKKL